MKEIRPSRIFRIEIDFSKTLNNMSIEDAENKMIEELGEFFTEEMREKGKVALNGDEIVYIRDEGSLSNKFYNTVNKYFNSTIKDVSKLVIKDNSLLSDMDDYCREYSFKMFEQYRKDYSDIDDILDKIIDKGIDYLDDIDKDILENKNPLN
jgi:RNA processing factor Prp31